MVFPNAEEGNFGVALNDTSEVHYEVNHFANIRMPLDLKLLSQFR